LQEDERVAAELACAAEERLKLRLQALRRAAAPQRQPPPRGSPRPPDAETTPPRDLTVRKDVEEAGPNPYRIEFPGYIGNSLLQSPSGKHGQPSPALAPLPRDAETTGPLLEAGKCFTEAGVPSPPCVTSGSRESRKQPWQEGAGGRARSASLQASARRPEAPSVVAPLPPGLLRSPSSIIEASCPGRSSRRSPCADGRSALLRRALSLRGGRSVVATPLAPGRPCRALTSTRSTPAASLRNLCVSPGGKVVSEAGQVRCNPGQLMGIRQGQSKESAAMFVLKT
jgi:hypothetical protein